MLLWQFLRRNIGGWVRGRHELLLLLLLLQLHGLEEARLLVDEPNVAGKQEHVQEAKDLRKEFKNINNT